MSDVQYRWINGIEATQQEWDDIDMILAARGWMSWNRETTRVLIAEDERGLVGFLPIQLMPHVEPLWVRPDRRGGEVADTLAETVVKYMEDSQARGWIVVAESPFARKMCEERGWHHLKSPVYIVGGV